MAGLVGLVGLALTGCLEPVAPSAPIVYFMMDSPTCGGPITFAFYIDQGLVGTESLRDDQPSQPYNTTPGQHALRAAWVGGSFARDTTVTLSAGDTYIDVFAPYCS